tara:strand:+ start:512 stop:640 length:129 start_codon:yes stop_codon:yes gene_type:complete
MPMGKGTYGNKKGRPPKKAKKMAGSCPKKKMAKSTTKKARRY